VPGYYVQNFGCRATQADGAALERQFEERGVARASTPAQASIVVLNTCTVTAAADQDARAAIRRVRRKNPDAQIVVTGCYAQRAPEEIAALPGVSFVIGNSHKHQLAEIALRGTESPPAGTFVSIDALTSLGQRLTTDDQRPVPDGSPIFVSDIFAHTELLAAPVFDAAGPNENERTRPNLKVQDGCDNRCSFCVIPYVRGQSRSLEMSQVIREVNALVDSGYREVVISGINLGRWGRDLAVDDQASRFAKEPSSDLSGAEALTEKQGAIAALKAPRHPKSNLSQNRSAIGPGGQRPTTNDQRLTSLIRAILAETSLEKLRISSVEPMDWSDEFIALVASSPRIAKHAHVPMQSGSDAVLRRMHRKYRPWHYREKIEKIRAAMPSAAIGADVMAGFPGETDAEFEATRRLIDELPLTYLHVFTYSARPGTPASVMPNQVPISLARERNAVLRELAAEKKLAFMRSFIGKTVEAITLNVVGSDDNSEFTEALTDNYLKLHLSGRHAPNQWLSARVEDVVDGALAGWDERQDTNYLTRESLASQFSARSPNIP
jgi:threonylcarbamoyladenosine tRNA methylthiotransferase MtaB